MAILVNNGKVGGGWFYVKRNPAGLLVWSIYPHDALPDSELDAVRAQFPTLQFKSDGGKYEVKS